MEKLSRRRFLSYSAACLIAPGFINLFCPMLQRTAHAGFPDDVSGHIFPGDAPKVPGKYSHEAFLYSKSSRSRVICRICPNTCVLSPGDRSICRSKVNIDGILYSLAYGNPCSVHVDPVEKKPLYHFRPGSRVFSIATTGCNLRCLNCQNWEISQARPEDVRSIELFPDAVVKAAHESGSDSVAYTYSEPVTFFEYMIDTARLAREQGITNLLISNGYIRPEPLKELCSVLDAANINLKSFSNDIYLKLNGGRLEYVLEALKILHERGVHLEITNLVVPGYTDSPDMVKRMCAWIVNTLGQDHPVHFLRFFPRYKLDRLPSTPVSTLERFRQIALDEGIRYVYLGNVPEHDANNTYCHQCGALLVRRQGYTITKENLDGTRCASCKSVIPGVWRQEGKTGQEQT
ncbi:MAG: AmmeMemoRadiSam system radical SAM enzyme [Desulfomonilia bacterium]